MDPLIEAESKAQKIKQCPKCTRWTEKISGCNYIKCVKGCEVDWCWQCEKIKYIQDGCNDKGHNSH